MLVDRILLVHIQLEEPVVSHTLEVLVSLPHLSFIVSLLYWRYSRVELLIVRIDELLLCDLNEGRVVAGEEVTFVLDGTVVDLANELNDKA